MKGSLTGPRKKMWFFLRQQSYKVLQGKKLSVVSPYIFSHFMWLHQAHQAKHYYMGLIAQVHFYAQVKLNHTFDYLKVVWGITVSIQFTQPVSNAFGTAHHSSCQPDGIINHCLKSLTAKLRNDANSNIVRRSKEHINFCYLADFFYNAQFYFILSSYCLFLHQ